eukprot:TRINITY_DN6285_c0_g1_i2.p1 TRINITY_DN6285_c0_g1~~TRINITY_DN6285_c0_g1_i2.p1  ORF type:complete len:634 (+),score=63.19 TRINITY_DN6285_c0_g1_i2:88-1989(+)
MGEPSEGAMSQVSTAGTADKAEFEDSARETSMCAVSSKERRHRSRLCKLSNFEIAYPELLRATQAGLPLRFCGAALRQNLQLRPPSAVVSEADHRNRSDNFHPWSRAVLSIHEFWSHSWRASAWLKAVVLLLEYNLFAATTAGTSAAFVDSALVAAGVLPYGAHVSLMGALFFVLTLLCWHSRRRVFLDKISISQTHEKTKLDGVLGLGAFLKASNSLLVLLDSTYMTRLWCVFELAAFSKLRERHPDKVVRFAPLPFGSTFVALFIFHTITASFRLFEANAFALKLYDLPPHRLLNLVMVLPTVVIFWPVFHILRSYQDVLKELKAQLGGFSLHASNCYCCAVGHVDPETHARLNCDREAVEACIDAWFGSVKDFDAFVRQRLFDEFAQTIGRTGIPFKLILLASLLQIWAWMEGVAFTILQKGSLMETNRIKCLYCAFIEWPLMVAALSALAHGVRRRLSSCVADAFLSFFVSIAATVLFAMDRLLLKFIIDRENQPILSFYIVALGILTFWIYHGCGSCRRFGTGSSSSLIPGQTHFYAGEPSDVASQNEQIEDDQDVLPRSKQQSSLHTLSKAFGEAAEVASHADTGVVGSVDDQLDEAVEYESENTGVVGSVDDPLDEEAECESTFSI